jgi:hypothetical protein
MAGRRAKAAAAAGELAEVYDEAAADRSLCRLCGIVGGYLNHLEVWVRDGGEETFDGDTRDAVFDAMGKNEQLLADLARIRARG